MQGKIERLWFAQPKFWSAIRLVSLSILFITGILCVIGSNIADHDLLREWSNPHPTAVGYKSAERNKLLLKKWRKEGELAESEAFDGKESSTAKDLRRELAEIEIQLAKLREEAEKRMSQQFLDSGGCFTADMWVLTAGGAKPIVDIKVGDSVLSVDEAGHQITADVLKTFETKNYHYFLINDKIKVTAMHRFFTNDGWKRARDLKVGDRIQTTTGLFEEIVSIEWFAKNLDVYNLTISKNHNFFISPDGKNGYLVHNTGGGDGGGGGK